jgi:hypothetical protein
VGPAVRNYAATRDVPTMPKREVCVLHMAQRWRGNSAALRDVLIMFKREAFVLCMVLTHGAKNVQK